ncbi:hypothetical protein [Janthinobacterium agaricidamnosum]|uniref:hypothetical protein n=1 Tax=Janthinobacterium agaricidamnosum TaxID=55508 RepID=UPI0011870D76|nr:hypothetical protein [Janthinobacterium agaricidamnosum]
MVGKQLRHSEGWRGRTGSRQDHGGAERRPASARAASQVIIAVMIVRRRFFLRRLMMPGSGPSHIVAMAFALLLRHRHVHMHTHLHHGHLPLSLRRQAARTHGDREPLQRERGDQQPEQEFDDNTVHESNRCMASDMNGHAVL